MCSGNSTDPPSSGKLLLHKENSEMEKFLFKNRLTKLFIGCVKTPYLDRIKHNFFHPICNFCFESFDNSFTWKVKRERRLFLKPSDFLLLISF